MNKIDLEKNKKIVWDFWEAIFNQHDLQIANTLLAEGYIQHNPLVPTGKDGFNMHFQQVFVKFPEISTEIKRIIAEDNYVVLHSCNKRNQEDRGKAHIDIFRIENEKIIEHWDVIQEVPETMAHTNTMF